MFSIILFTKMERRQPSRFLPGGKKVNCRMALNWLNLEMVMPPTKNQCLTQCQRRLEREKALQQLALTYYGEKGHQPWWQAEARVTTWGLAPLLEVTKVWSMIITQWEWESTTVSTIRSGCMRRDCVYFVAKSTSYDWHHDGCGWVWQEATFYPPANKTNRLH